MQKVTDVALNHPLVQRINKEHVYKTLDAMHVCGVGDHVLPGNFFRRNSYDQRRYFQVVLDLMYCTTCRRPMPKEVMQTDCTCRGCAAIRDENWEKVRTRRHDKLVDYDPITRYQERTKLRLQRDAHIENFIAAHKNTRDKNLAHVDASNGEAPSGGPTHENAWDILERASRRTNKA